MSRWQLAMRLVGVGFFIGGAIALGAGAGWWLDRRFETEPVLLIAGLLLGITVAVYGVYQMLLPLMGKRQSKGNE